MKNRAFVQSQNKKFSFLNTKFANKNSSSSIRNKTRFANRARQLENKYLRQAQRVLRASIESEQCEQVREILSTNKFVINSTQTSLIENSYSYSLLLDKIDFPDNREIKSDVERINNSFENTLSTSSSPKAPRSSSSTISLQSTDSIKKSKTLRTIRKIDWSNLYLDKNREDNALHCAARLGKTCLIDILLDSGHFFVEDKNRSESNDTPLCIACDSGSIDCAKLLIARGANLNHENGKSKTPLILATELIYPYDLQMCKLLLENGALVNHVTKSSNTCLLSASKFGNLELVELLIQANANVNVQFSEGVTSLMRACYYNYANVVKCLIENGAQIETKNVRQESALYIAAFRGNLQIVQMLVDQYGADVNSVDKDGDTPLSVACYEDKPDVIEFLLDRKANVNARGIRGDSVLHIASSNCDRKIVERLIESGGDCDALNDDRETPLHIVIRQNRIDTLKLLLEHSKNLDQCSLLGNKTVFKCLIETCQIEKLQMAQCMIRAGCDVNKSFKSNLHLAEMNNNNNNNEHYRTIFNLPNDSPFESLFRITKNKCKFYQQTSDVSDKCEDPFLIIVNLIELILRAGYKLSTNDYKLYKESWICSCLSKNEPLVERKLDNMFKFYLNCPPLLKNLCKYKTRELLHKPVSNSIDTLNIPKQLRCFLRLDVD